ncbi:MAG TPA: non-canonical purine NTP pyrophosphatase [Acidobacteriota bacterium]|nr:non-canonical purine NTP pyrophosphatase [Acidobacteriota bacterium]
MTEPLYFITGNSMKFAEAKAIIPQLIQKKIDLTEVQELDPRKILQAKMLEAKKHGLDRCIVEDTGLYFECLKGYPGPLVKWMLEAVGSQGIVDLVHRYDNHRAVATSSIALYISADQTIRYFDGELLGSIVAKRGLDHGWSAIFQPDGLNQTYGELTVAQKNAISHRSKSFGALKLYLDSLQK